MNTPRASATAAVLTLAFCGWAAAAEVPLKEIAAPPAVQPPAEVSAEPSAPEATSRLQAISFAGNKRTRERTLLRELPFSIGDQVSDAQLEMGRQAIQNLNLYREVTLQQKASGQGGIEALYTVKEKWYLLAYPRVDGNANGEYAYGAQVDWNNLWGLNHALRFSALRKDTQREGIGIEQNLTIGYRAPRVFDSLWSVDGGVSYTDRPVSRPGVDYQETLGSLQLLGSKSLNAAEPSQGWSVGTGLLLSHQQTDSGVEQYGDALGPVAVAGYRDLKLNIYSEEGTVFSSRLDAAKQGVAADYDFARLTLNAIRYVRVGATAHQTVHFFGDAGFNWDGPKTVRNFTLGGVGALRGYEHGFREGNAFFRVGSEWARPVYWPWLRAVVIAEAGNVYAQPNEFELTKVRASIGLGLRIRITTFVNVQLEAGAALPIGGGSVRYFAGQLSP